METNYGELQIGISKRYGEEILVETTVDASERGGAEKVLSLEAEAKTTGVDFTEGEASVTGKVNFRLLYLDREGKPCGLDCFKDFKCRVSGEEITPSGRCAVTLSIPDADARLRGEEIVLSAATMVTVRYFGERQERAVTSVSEGETRLCSVCTERAKRSERTVEVDKVVELGQEVKKILLFDAQAVVSRLDDKEEGREVVGEVRASVVFLNQAEEPVEIGAVIPFAESFDKVGAEYAVSVKNARIVLTDEEGGGTAEIEAAVLIEEVSYERAESEVVSAVCFEKAEAVEQTAVTESERFVGQAFCEEVLMGSVPLAQEGYVAFVRPGCHAIATAESENGAVKVEGVAAFQAVCLTGEGYFVQSGEFPFSFRVPCEGAKEGCRAEARLTVTDVKGVQNGKDLSVTAKAALSVSLFETDRSAYLSDVAEGAPYPESEAGISVYFAEKQETVWEIAKAMHALPSALLKANPALEEEGKEKRTVVLVRRV